MKKLFYLFILLMVFIPSSVFATNEVNVYFFHKSTCDICEQERIYLQALKDRYPNMRVYSYEISNEDNYKLLEKARELFNDKREGVPYTVVADTPLNGFNQNTKGNIQRLVYKASLEKYENKLGQMLNISYKDDLDIEVKEYKENSEYTIEEKGTEGKHPKAKTYNSIIKKYKASIILITIGILLIMIYIKIRIKERRDY